MAYLTGFHAIEEMIKSSKASGLSCGPLLVAKAGPRAKEIVSLAINNKIRIERTGVFDLENLAPDNRGIAMFVSDHIYGGGGAGGGNSADISLENFIEELGDKKNVLVLILDEITDPHNYGAILRSCDQFAVDLVISRSRRSAKHAAVISQTSAGAVSWVPQAETPNLVRAMENLKDADFWIYGADMDGEPVYKKDLKGRTALVLGSEGSGISRLIYEKCDGFVGIPSSGRIDSLNVSVAAGILLYDIRRQMSRK
ncbi:MAG: 23S rRNA (guanosine(2251)-2'-O)-methyltransferase RlmB [Treponema sp.]|nr:23S rRNA (guanosine(2251)-2'-O)-methyltransferase RlmB [Treponema sp.]